jgi:predicted enzyme related to lactoylglutathione lyase
MKSITWVDLTLPDAEGIRDFYAAVMGWRPEPVPMGDYSDFSMCDATGDAAAGVCHARGGNAGLPPVWMVYFQVSDLDDCLAQARAAGGTVLQEPRGAGGGRYAVLRDPAGTVFAVAESNSEG